MNPIAIGWAKLPGTAIMIATELRNFAHAVLPRGPAAWATRQHAEPSHSTLRRRRVAHPTKSRDMMRVFETRALDESEQISAFVKLKLTQCAPISGLPEKNLGPVGRNRFVAPLREAPCP
jgi:hypothetical protein